MLRLKQGDGIFVILTIASIGYGVSQFAGLLKTTAGINLSWLTLWEGFMILMFLLSLKALKEAKGMTPGGDKDEKYRKSIQAAVSYGLGAVMNGFNAIYLAYHLTTFNQVDTWNFTFAAIALPVAFLVFWKKWSRPAALTCFAILCKAAPQLFMAWRLTGASSSPANFAWVLFMGHVLIILRLLILHRSYKRKREKPTLGLITSEWANEISWILVTLAWVWVVGGKEWWHQLLLK